MINIDILSHFDHAVNAQGIHVYTLKEAERATFFAKLPLPFRLMYLSDEDLTWRTANTGSTRAEEVITKIPDNPSLMSGEFAEILTYYFIPERYAPDSRLRPPKWRWKESKNNPAHFTDVIIFHQIDPDQPNVSDSLISIESKSKATQPVSSASSLQDAITDAQKDSTSRLAESLFHVKTKYKDEKNLEALKQLERFMDAVKFPTFLKHFKAIGVVDGAFANTHLANVTAIPTNIKDSFEVILIRIENLKGGYEHVYTQMQNT